jgi:DNA invertase Pin-like site-specific DNA recombinase
MRTVRNMLGVINRVAVALLRRSTGMQDKSIAEQREFIQQWARQNGYTILAEYIDDAISGDDHQHRAAFDRLMQDLMKPGRPWNAILAFDRSRFTRADIYEAASYADRILKAGADVFFCAEGKSLSTDHEIVWAVDTFQKHEILKQTSRDTLRGMLALARKGYWCGGPIPYGFDADIVDKFTQKSVRRIRLIRRKRTRPDGSCDPAIHHILDTEGNFLREVQSSVEHTLPLKSEAELTRLVFSEELRIDAIRLIYDLMANREKGFKAIAKVLNRKGIPPPGGHGLWRTSAVKAIVENPIYRGLFEWNSRTEAKYNFIQNGTMVPKPRSAKSQVFLHEEQDRIHVPLPELAIVTPELWHRAHAARARRADIHYVEQKRLVNRSPLGGRIYCGQCGAKMYGHLRTKTKLVAGKPHTYVDDVYVCSTYMASGSDQCGFNKVPRQEIEGFLLAKIRELVAPAKNSDNLRLLARARLGAFAEKPKAPNPATLQKRLKELEDRVAILERLDAQARATIGQEAAYHEAKEEIARISKQLEAGGTKPETRIDVRRAAQEIVECIGSLDDIESMGSETHKAVFGKFLDHVVLNFKKVPKGKRNGSVLESGQVTFAPLPSCLGIGSREGLVPPALKKVFRADGSGGGI